tara:strand:- start:1264 stop:1878 length:615 start_codon:yes stop_codon:yes gene_type:complete
MLKFYNDKGFTLIELIMVTIILGILAAVAVPKYLNLTQKAERAVERGVVTQLRAAVEQYADNKFATEGRYQYPENPFDLVEVEGYVGFEWDQIQDGAWFLAQGESDVLRIFHRRRNNTVYGWTYSAMDRSDAPGDDRGANVGETVMSNPIDNDGDGVFEDCEGNNLSEDENTVGVCWNDWRWDGECLTCSEDWEQNSIYASNNE